MANANQRYGHVAAGEGPTISTFSDINIKDGRSNFEKSIVVLGLSSGVLFIVGSLFYAGHCAQVLANEVQGTVFWSPKLAGMIAMLGLLSQVILVSIPFKRCLQNPVLCRYTEEGFHTTAKVLKREVKENGKNKVFKMILVYQPVPGDRNTIYEKKIEVKEAEFPKTEFPIVVLPYIPTSAILERVYEVFLDPCSRQSICRGFISFVAPILWILAIFYDVSMKFYSETDFWTQWGFGLLFSVSLLSSLCGGYLLVVSEIKQWLFGGACRIERVGDNNTDSSFPNDGYSDESPDEKEAKSALELHQIV